MPVASVGLKSMSLPEFGEPKVMPLVTRNTHEARIDALRARGAKAGFDAFAVYGDREHAANIEDGIALADDALREELAARYPEAWGRVEARCAFMSDVLGIRLKPEVLPFSNIPAFLPPFWLSRNSAMAVTSR
jgi:hypothetical protein